MAERKRPEIPPEGPGLTIISSDNQQITFKYFNKATGREGKPPGVMGCLVQVYVSKANPGSSYWAEHGEYHDPNYQAVGSHRAWEDKDNHLYKSIFVTNNPCRIQLPWPYKSYGQQCTIIARWAMNRSAESSPSTTLTHTIH